MILFFWEWAIFCRRFFAVSFRETSFWIFDQEFQVPKMEVLNLIRLFLGWVFPYISLTYIFYRWGFLHCRSLPEMFGDYSTELFWISNYRGLAQQKKYLGFRSRWVGFDVSCKVGSLPVENRVMTPINGRTCMDNWGYNPFLSRLTTGRGPPGGFYFFRGGLSNTVGENP